MNNSLFHAKLTFDRSIESTDEWIFQRNQTVSEHFSLIYAKQIQKKLSKIEFAAHLTFRANPIAK